MEIDVPEDQQDCPQDERGHKDTGRDNHKRGVLSRLEALSEEGDAESAGYYGAGGDEPSEAL